MQLSFRNKLTGTAQIRRVNTSQIRLQLYLLQILLDQAALCVGFELASVIRGAEWMSPVGIQLIFLAMPLYLMMALMRDAYSRETLMDSRISVKRGLHSLALTAAIVVIAIFFFGASGHVSRIGTVMSLVFSAILIGSARYGFSRTIKAHKSDQLLAQLVVLDDPAVDPGHYRNCNFVNAENAGLSPNVDDPYMMHQLGLLLGQYDRVIIHCQAERRDDWALVLKGANVTGEIVQPGLSDMGAIGIGSFGNEATMVVARGPLSLPSRAQKRALDIAITVPVLIGFLPLMLLVALAIKLNSRGPIFFKQNRIGRGNRLFNIYKFRSMRVEQADSRGARSASRDDDRITAVGRIIRRTSIDELPQLINVLLGDMSLVGPRPHALGSLAGDKLFWEVSREYWCRHALKPGITGLAQVRGFRGATHQRSDLQNRLDADLEYLVGWTLMRDITIMLTTFKVILHRNAY